MTTNQPTPDPTPDRREVKVAARLITAEVRRVVEAYHNHSFEELGDIVARRLDRAGLITRSE